MSFVDFFPSELTEVVFSYLSVPDLVNSSMVCVSWYEASNLSSIWRAAIKRSNPKDRFRILSNLDRFAGIASNYDDNSCFQVDRRSPYNLSPMNQWKLSLCQNNFVQSNWHGSHNTILARHRIRFEDDMDLEKMRIVFPSKLPQDCLYLPILAKKAGQVKKDFLLIRLDGTPRIAQKILSSKSKILIVCIDRDCIVWVQDKQVKYLSLVESKYSSQIESLGILVSESTNKYEICQECNYNITMDDKYIVASFWNTFVKIWCKKTKQLKFTYELTKITSTIVSNSELISCYLYNERIYFSYVTSHPDTPYFFEIFDIEKAKLLETPFSTEYIISIAFSDKYYAILCDVENFYEISVREIGTNEVKIILTVNMMKNYDPEKVWIVHDKVLYIEQGDLKILSLVDWNVSNGISTSNHFNSIYDVWDRFLLLKDNNNIVTIWDWELGRKLRELRLDILSKGWSGHFFNDETRLVIFDWGCVHVFGFW